MTVKEQIIAEEENLNQNYEMDKEENILFKSTLEAIILLSLKYDLENTYQRQQFLKKVKSLFITLNKKLSSLYKTEFTLKTTEKVLGYTVNELVASLSTKKYIDIKKLTNVNKSLSSEELNYIFKDKYKKDAIKETLAKYVYEKKLDNQTSEYGWVSVAILDKRTSDICRHLDNKFYSSNTYKTRADIPNRPPRHFRCRSVIIKVDNKEDRGIAESIEYKDL